ncbi:unnamed protein product [Leptidea sinapis]|uniref:Uncharacterized protein n=1 Tax=Leptidea sinapis TaxID=189913 RepID=A0A5E4Q541_9NEOP|nr:unnamed protein product [Leptidea sinapis]
MDSIIFHRYGLSSTQTEEGVEHQHIPTASDAASDLQRRGTVTARPVNIIDVHSPIGESHLHQLSLHCY